MRPRPARSWRTTSQPPDPSAAEQAAPAAGSFLSCNNSGVSLTESASGRSIGLVMTSAIVVGTVIGSGIFLLPVSLAPLGINAPIAWVISGLGALCIAFALSSIVRPEGAGLQSYVEAELGATAGFVVTFALWISCWTAMASTAVAAAAALSWIVPSLNDPWSVAM